MEILEDGVKLNFEEYAEYKRALHALAALRPHVPSFNTTSRNWRGGSMIYGPRLEPNHDLEEYINYYCLYQTTDEDVLCVDCGECGKEEEDDI